MDTASTSIKVLIEAGKNVYGYDDDDLELLRKEYRVNPEGLKLALSTDPLIDFYLWRQK